MAKKIRQRKPWNTGISRWPLIYHQVNDDGTDSAYCEIDGERYDLPGAYDSPESNDAYGLIVRLLDSRDIEIQEIENGKRERRTVHRNEVVAEKEIHFEHGGLVFTANLVVESKRRLDSGSVRSERAEAAKVESNRKKKFEISELCDREFGWVARGNDSRKSHDYSNLLICETAEEWLRLHINAIAENSPRFHLLGPDEILRFKGRIFRQLVQRLKKGIDKVCYDLGAFESAVAELEAEGFAAFRNLKNELGIGS